MDFSQEAANKANIETARLTRVLVFIVIATLVVCAIAAIFAAWPIIYPPDPARPKGSGLMATGWVSVILLCGSAVFIAVALIVVAFRQWKNKDLASQLSALSADLATEKAKVEAER